MRATWRAFPTAPDDEPGAILRLDAGERIAAGITGRQGGRSTGPLASLNLSTKADDDPNALAANRTRIVRALGLDAPVWVHGEQVHGGDVAEVRRASLDPVAEPAGGPSMARIGGVDALVTSEPGLALAILVADCVPVLLADPTNGRIGVAHAGWRGLVAGVVGATVAMLDAPNVRAYVGPSIGPCCFEVGNEVAEELAAAFDGSILAEGAGENPHVDLWRTTVLALRAAGVTEIGMAAACTRCEPHRWFSHRAGSSGRQALVAALR